MEAIGPMVPGPIGPGPRYGPLLAADLRTSQKKVMCPVLNVERHLARSGTQIWYLARSGSKKLHVYLARSGTWHDLVPGTIWYLARSGTGAQIWH